MPTFTTTSYVIALLAGSFALGKGMDDVARAEVKQQVSNWLNRIDLSANRTTEVHRLLLTVFNDIFSTSIFSRQFVWRSIQFSTLSSVIVTISLFAHYATTNVESPAFRLLKDPIGLALASLVILFAAGLCDYLSLSKSSLIINAATFIQTPLRYYVLDLIVTMLMSASWVLLLAVTLAALGSAASLDKQPDNLGHLIVFSLFSGLTMLAPTLFTLAIVLAMYFARAALLVGKPLQLLKLSVLDTSSKPFTSIAVLSWPLVLMFAAVSIAIAA